MEEARTTGPSGALDRTDRIAEPTSVRSALVVDCGSVFTRVGLLDRVDGHHRLLAISTLPTSSAPPHADVMQTICAAIKEVEQLCARVLMRDGQVSGLLDTMERGWAGLLRSAGEIAKDIRNL